ncbi:hypothetical protein SAMN05421640_0092 [Ekhidna lutea]|uniref:CAAX prenyl protease 2/Lysostaphin resistance protein A-like domain-containing protein n=1 Tax=Ekhidna lutea TaxID=447679 RepID=A0A239EDU8_EKHLU|nr:type II CAAX endopeptidase family protein [Ekhidna lutea]SNS42699.1 hypothetical protein SAMN05421640_0092 [Ekhidna lutea]
MKIKRIRPLLIAIGIPITFTTLLFFLYSISEGIIPFPYSKYWYGIIGSVCAFAAIFIIMRLDKKPLRGFNLKFNKSVMPNFIKGLAVGVVIAVVMIGSQIWFSNLTMTFNQQNVSSFMIMVLCILPLAFMEELTFKSYAFFKLEKEYGIWNAQIVTSILFALYHVVGGWSITSAFLGPGVWALAFGLMAIISGGISMPTGFHSGLNLILAAVGDKEWIPALWTVDFANPPTEEMIQSNSNFGLALQLISLLVLILSTWIYSKRIRHRIK